MLYDDRAERAGVKFKDADLIGIPLRIGIGQRHPSSNAVDWKLRWQAEVEQVPLSQLASRVRNPLELESLTASFQP